MPKKRERISTGLSAKDITNIPMAKFQSYTPSQQRELVSRLGSAVNKRLRTFERNEVINPAVLRINQSGGKISVKGKANKELIEEFYRAKQFLQSEYGSMKQWRTVEKKIEQSMNDKQPIRKGMEKDVITGLAFSYYDVIREIDSRLDFMEKYKVVDKIAEMVENGKNEQEILNNILNETETQYNKEQERYNQQNVSFGQRLEQEKPKRFRRKRG